MPTTTVSTRRVRPDLWLGLKTGAGVALITIAWLFVFGILADHPIYVAWAALGGLLAFGVLWALLWPLLRRRGLVMPSLVAAVVLAVLESLLTDVSTGAVILTGFFDFVWLVRQYRGK